MQWFKSGEVILHLLQLLLIIFLLLKTAYLRIFNKTRRWVTEYWTCHLKKKKYMELGRGVGGILMFLIGGYILKIQIFFSPAVRG